MAKILVLHGPNLNMLGQREPDIYGHETLADINTTMMAEASRLGHELVAKQSNAEHDLIGWIQHALQDGFVFLIFNPGAYTHTSVALRDALLSVKLPFIETHLSNPHTREAFRRQSYFSDIAKGVICGFGSKSYLYALRAINDYLLQ